MKTRPDPTAVPGEATEELVPARRNPLSPKKLLLSKWTAVQPLNREKHFVVVRVIEPEPPATRIAQVELEAVYSGRLLQLHWRDLTDPLVWRQGWV
jgi:tryptophan-rich hypothetical protein